MRFRVSRHRLLGVALTGLALVAGLTAHADDETLGWLTGLPGLTRQADKAVATGTQWVFAATDGPAAFEAVRAGLKKRLWTIDKATDVDMGVAAVSNLRASREGQRIKVTLNATTGRSLLVVTLSGTAGAAARRDASATDAAAAAQALVGSLLGGAPAADDAQLALFDNGVEQTHDCKGRRVAANGNGSRLTFTGECPTVTANGNDNVIVIRGRVGHISTVGSRNTVSWSATANPDAPRVSDLGRDNRVARSGGSGQR